VGTCRERGGKRGVWGCESGFWSLATTFTGKRGGGDAAATEKQKNLMEKLWVRKILSLHMGRGMERLTYHGPARSWIQNRRGGWINYDR